MIDTFKTIFGIDTENATTRQPRKYSKGNVQLISALTELVAEINKIKSERDSLREENTRLWRISESKSIIEPDIQKKSKPEVCNWSTDQEWFGWRTDCGEYFTFEDGGPIENRFKFCHACGKVLKVKD